MARNSKKHFACGAIFGGIVGGLCALLFAPKSGEKLRKDISKKYCTVSEKTCELIDGVCEQTSELIEKAKDIACSAKQAASKICRED